MQIIDTLQRAGFEAYAVGGCIRDSLLHRIPKDWDLCTSARPEEIKLCFSREKLLETGIRHGTVTLLTDDGPFEITTFRTEGEYLDHRHPSRIAFVTSLREDLARRDFTVNAIASDGKRLFDPFGGQADLDAGVLRCVGEPRQRLEEDALRLLRALRFCSVYGFSVEPATAQAIHDKKELLQLVSAERVRSELDLLICGDFVEPVLLDFSDVLAVVIPEIVEAVGFEQHNPYHSYDVWTHIVKSVAASPKELPVRLTMLFHDLAKPRCYFMGEDGRGHFYGHPAQSKEIAEKTMKKLRYDNKLTEKVALLVGLHDRVMEPEKKLVRRWLAKVGENSLRQLVSVHQADAAAKSPLGKVERLNALQQFLQQMEEELRQSHCFSVADLAVTGWDLMEAGIPKGPLLGETLNFLLEQVLEERAPNKKEALLLQAQEFLQRPRS